MIMKRKIVLTVVSGMCIISLALILIVSKSSAMENNNEILKQTVNEEMESIEKEKALEEKESIEKEEALEKKELLEKHLEAIDNQDVISEEDEEEYKEIMSEINEIEIEYDLYDYQQEVEIRLNTVKACVADLQKELDRGVPEELEEDFKYRVKKLSPVIQKYDEILNASEETIDYKSIAEQLNTDLAKVYIEINGD